MEVGLHKIALNVVSPKEVVGKYAFKGNAIDYANAVEDADTFFYCRHLWADIDGGKRLRFNSFAQMRGFDENVKAYHFKGIFDVVDHGDGGTFNCEVTIDCEKSILTIISETDDLVETFADNISYAVQQMNSKSAAKEYLMGNGISGVSEEDNLYWKGYHAAVNEVVEHLQGKGIKCDTSMDLPEILSKYM